MRAAAFSLASPRCTLRVARTKASERRRRPTKRDWLVAVEASTSRPMLVPACRTGAERFVAALRTRLPASAASIRRPLRRALPRVKCWTLGLRSSTAVKVSSPFRRRSSRRNRIRITRRVVVPASIHPAPAIAPRVATARALRLTKTSAIAPRIVPRRETPASTRRRTAGLGILDAGNE